MPEEANVNSSRDTQFVQKIMNLEKKNKKNNEHLKHNEVFWGRIKQAQIFSDLRNG